jgi:hypothetical protein
MSLFAIEREARRECPAQPSKAGHRTIPASVRTDLETAIARDDDLDLVSLLQFQRLHDRGGKANGQAVPPSSDLHASPLHWIYIERM